MPHLSKQALTEALLTINKWHPNTPLLLVFSRQNPGAAGRVLGNVDAVRATYDRLFNLDSIGIEDATREFYLHCCHGTAGARDYPYATRKPSENYGKTHQRIIKDTFANPQGFLTRESEGTYRLRDKAAAIISQYLHLDTPLDLRPLVLLTYWNVPEEARVVGDLWQLFDAEFHVTKAPFASVFTCSGLSDPLPLAKHDEQLQLRQIFLPDEYGTGQFDIAFWNRFRTLLEARLNELQWHGRIGPLVASITSALMHDHSLFLLGAPGTGKTTIVTGAILPALREAIGTTNPLRFSEFPITPATTTADVFGFQGLDGQWVPGPFVRDVLQQYGPSSSFDAPPDTPEPATQAPPTHLVFFDEANRIDIEALLSPIQSALDRIQARKPSGVVTLGGEKYVLPDRFWSIFAGNSPATDIGRKEQSRPFKRRVSVVIPPDPMDELLANTARFRAACLDILGRASRIDAVDVRDPALALLGDLKSTPDRIEDLRLVLLSVHQLPSVAVTVGLLESLLLRAAAHKAIRQDSPLDASLAQTLVGLISGDATSIESVISIATERGFTTLSSTLQRHVVHPQSTSGRFGIDSVL